VICFNSETVLAVCIMLDVFFAVMIINNSDILLANPGIVCEYNAYEALLSSQALSTFSNKNVVYL